LNSGVDAGIGEALPFLATDGLAVTLVALGFFYQERIRHEDLDVGAKAGLQQVGASAT
jgi:hypothetical protein